MLNENFSECWRYRAKDNLLNRHRKHLTIHDGHIMFFDRNGNYHKLDMNGNLCEYKKHGTKNCLKLEKIVLYMKNINTPKEFQKLLKDKLEMSYWYEMNWNVFLDIGVENLPDELILDGWNIYKSKQTKDALIFEEIMKKYNESKYVKHCKCIYLHYEP